MVSPLFSFFSSSGSTRSTVTREYSAGEDLSSNQHAARKSFGAASTMTLTSFALAFARARETAAANAGFLYDEHPMAWRLAVWCRAAVEYG